MADPERVSVLLPVHAGVAREELAAALESLERQTRPADEVVIVEDGPLTPGLRQVLDRYTATRPDALSVRLPTNGGAGVANQAGLEAATGTWIVKMDADDILLPHRIETQLAAVRERGLDVCGAAMWEFEEDPGRRTRIRSNPVSHQDIVSRMRFNNPINHPTAVYRRTLALEAGGYPPMRYMQDYDLFGRMLVAGARMGNLAEPLVLFRAGEAMRRRRSARGFLALEWQLQRRLRDYGLVGRARGLVNFAVRAGFRQLPPRLMRLVYRAVLSEPTGTR